MDRATIYDHIEQLKAKPVHVRHRIAFGTAAGFTGVVAVVWLTVLIFSGNLALNPVPANSALSSASGTQNNAPQSPFQQLLGGVNAALTGATTSPAALTPVDQTGDTSSQNSATGNGYTDTNSPTDSGANGYSEPATTTTTGTGGDQSTISF